MYKSIFIGGPNVEIGAFKKAELGHPYPYILSIRDEAPGCIKFELALNKEQFKQFCDFFAECKKELLEGKDA